MHTVQLLLKTSKYERHEIDRRFHALAHLHNVCVKHARKCMIRLQHDKRYAELRQLYNELVKKEKMSKEEKSQKKKLAKQLAACRTEQGLSKASLEHYIKVCGKQFSKLLSSQQVQAEADRVWCGVERCLFGNGKELHFKKLMDFDTIGGKSNKNGARFDLDAMYVNWLGLSLKCYLPKSENSLSYVWESLKGKISYCNIKRLMFSSGWRYYAEIVVSGAAPTRVSIGTSTMGIDPGVSTIAGVSEDACVLEELAPNAIQYEKKIQNLQKEIDALEQSYSRLERAYNNTYWVFNDSQREAYEKNIQLINDQIRALEQEANVAKKNWDFARYAQLNKEIKELNKQLKNAEENGDMFSIYEAQKKNLKQQQEDLRKQIQAEKDKKKTDNGKIQQWNEQIESITQQIEDLDRSMMETLAGTDVKTAIDEFADALVDAYCKGEDAAEALGEKTKEVLKKAVVEALKREFLAKGINDAVLYLGESMKDGKLTDVEKREFERMVNAAGDLFNSALEGIGDWIKDVEEETVQQDPLTGAVTSMSEETGGVIAGRLNAFVINQSDQTSIMRQALVYQAEIAANTKLSASELTEIKTTLKRIENKDSSLLSQGIA